MLLQLFLLDLQLDFLGNSLHITHTPHKKEPTETKRRCAADPRVTVGVVTKSLLATALVVCLGHVAVFDHDACSGVPRGLSRAASVRTSENESGHKKDHSVLAGCGDCRPRFASEARSRVFASFA